MPIAVKQCLFICLSWPDDYHSFQEGRDDCYQKVAHHPAAREPMQQQENRFCL